MGAESSFFLNQQNDLFPASVWGFSQHPPSINQPRPSRDQNEDSKRGSIDEDEDRETSQDDDLEDEFNEEEASLRSLLLAQVNKNKVNKKSKLEEIDTPIQSPSSLEKNENVELTQKDINSQTSKTETPEIENSSDNKKAIGPKFKRLKNGKVNKINASKEKQKLKAKLKSKEGFSKLTVWTTFIIDFFFTFSFLLKLTNHRFDNC